MKMEAVSGQIAAWIAERVRQAGAKGVVVGLSGGVDSAVVLALSRRAVGEEALGVIMPCESPEQDAQDALELAAALDAKTATVELDQPYRELLGSLPEGSEMARANLKARLRMCTLYFLANTLNYLVAGTGNRSELAVGYFTKYGDGGVDILPIGGLLKTQVRLLAAELGVPQAIIDKPPSAGLLPGQTDEGELGLTYEVLDSTIEALDRGDQPDAPEGAVDRIRALMRVASHKGSLPPVCSAWQE